MSLLKILNDSEIAGSDSPPVFNHEERKKVFFSLPNRCSRSSRKLAQASVEGKRKIMTRKLEN
jgi:hypothetical protein